MIPMNSTTISIIRAGTAAGPNEVDQLLSSYGAAEMAAAPVTTLSVVARGIRANIGSPTGTEQALGGSQETVTYRMQCDPIELDSRDQVRDDRTGRLYDVVWAVTRDAIPTIAHTAAGLTRSRGGA